MKSIPEVKNLRNGNGLGWAWTLVRKGYYNVNLQTNEFANGLWDEAGQTSGTFQFSVSLYKGGEKTKNKVREQIRRKMTRSE